MPPKLLEYVNARASPHSLSTFFRSWSKPLIVALLDALLPPFLTHRRCPPPHAAILGHAPSSVRRHRPCPTGLRRRCPCMARHCRLLSALLHAPLPTARICHVESTDLSSSWCRTCPWNLAPGVPSAPLLEELAPLDAGIALDLASWLELGQGSLI
jgi:hypothetical protein